VSRAKRKRKMTIYYGCMKCTRQEEVVLVGVRQWNEAWWLPGEGVSNSTVTGEKECLGTKKEKARNGHGYCSPERNGRGIKKTKTNLYYIKDELSYVSHADHIICI